MDARALIAEAIPPMFQACGNSYINAWLQQWLEGARDAGVYEGPVIGRIAEINVDHWYEVAKKRAAENPT